MTTIKCLVTALVLLGTVLGGAPAWGVTPYDDILVQKAVKDLDQENFDEALAELNEAWEKGTHSPEKAFLLGRTYRLMLNYPMAKKYLEEALRLKANLPQAKLMLADTLLSLEKPKEALPLLEELEATGYEPGQVAFLRGMTEAKQGRYSVALDYFQKASQDPKIAQEAKFQASLALAALNRLKEARETMQQAISVNPQTQTADFAQRYVGLLEKRYQETKPFRATVTTGYDYDSNVTLQPGGASAAAQSAGQGDQVFTQTVNFEYSINANQPFSVLTQYSYFQNFHPRLSTFDMMSHYAAVVPTYSYKSGRIWVPVSYNFVDVQSDKYFTGVLVTPTWLHLLNEHVGIEGTARFNRQYYWFPIGIPQDDRNGKDYGGSVGAYYFFKKQTGFLQARFSFDHNSTTGSNWDSSSYRLLFAALYPLTDRLKVNAFVDLNTQPFDHDFVNGTTEGDVPGAPFVQFPKRYDKTIITGLQITYNIWNGLDCNIHYFYSRDDSNTSLYNYTRHIVGAQLAYRY